MTLSWFSIWGSSLSLPLNLSGFPIPLLSTRLIFFSSFFIAFATSVCAVASAWIAGPICAPAASNPCMRPSNRAFLSWLCWSNCPSWFTRSANWANCSSGVAIGITYPRSPLPEPVLRYHFQKICTANSTTVLPLSQNIRTTQWLCDIYVEV